MIVSMLLKKIGNHYIKELALDKIFMCIQTEKNELLQINQIKAALMPKNIGSLTQLEIFPSVTSTNSYLLQKAKEGYSSGAVCLAEQQTEGRGRQDRKWYSPPGANIYCSILWQLPTGSGLSLAIAVMLVNALKHYGIQGLGIKWPNDVMASGRKLAGILIETVKDKVVIGIGLNIYLAPETHPQWISLTDITLQSIKRNELVACLLNEIMDKLPCFQQQGLNNFLSDWQQYDVLFNQPVSIHTPLNTVTGVAQGIQATGELKVVDEKGHLHYFAVGEVSCRLTK